MGRVPKIIHYCWFSPKTGGKPWSLVHYVCVRSAIEAIRPERVLFYCNKEPGGPWWDLTRTLVTPVPTEAPRKVFDRPLVHPAHQADIVRLEKLIEQGGIYLDVDVFVHRSFDDLLGYPTVLGEDGVKGEHGLCNAVILAEPQAAFVRRWFAEYTSFRSKGRDEYWDEHSIKLPRSLAVTYPDEIKILSHSAFFWPLWTEDHLEWIFKSNKEIPLGGVYANHLWETLAWDYLEDLTPRQVRSLDTNFHGWARPLLTGIPDDFGILPVTGRTLRSLRRAAKRVAKRTLRAVRLIGARIQGAQP